jgi:hypothetical protein
MKQETKDLINKIVEAGGNVELQWRYVGQQEWRECKFKALDYLSTIARGEQEYRIKPEPIPDKVYYDVVRAGRWSIVKEYDVWYRSPDDVRSVWGKAAVVVKLTISTDENGMETKKVELV